MRFLTDTRAMLWWLRDDPRLSGRARTLLGHEHCARVAELPLRHRDPFDRMLVAQAQEERVPILTADPKIAAYDVDVIW